jgi:hypothetical protein
VYERYTGRSQRSVPPPGIQERVNPMAFWHTPIPWSSPRRAYARQAEHRQGKGGFWKDADPDIPILKEAKAEYAKLQ